MDLKIKDVAELLSVSETTIRRWLLDGKIPAYRLNRQYRFSKIEIENWMMKQKLHLNSDQEKKSQSISSTPGNQQFSMYRAINRGGVFSNIQGETKEQMIRNTMDIVAEILQLDAEVLAELLLDREKLMPTALNNGFAVPHARECLQRVPFDLMTVVFPKKPIEYGALDQKPVDTLFFLFASNDKIHLHLLAKLAHLTSESDAVALLKSKPDKLTLLEFVRAFESKLS